MNNKVKLEMEQIEIPSELHQRSKLGIQKAKNEMRPAKRRYWTKFVTVAASFVIVASGYATYKNTDHNNLQVSPKSVFVPTNMSKMQPLKVEDVASLQVVGGLPGTKGSPLYQNTEETGKAIITDIVGWINASKPVGVQQEYGKHGYPMVIEIKMNDGKIINVETGYKCVSKTNDDGSGSKSCTSVKDEIVLSYGSNKMRAESPELYQWLKDGWKKD